MTDSNDIAEEIVHEEFKRHFAKIRDATQSSTSLQEDMYATSQIVCVKKHRKGEQCNCICSNSNSMDRMVVRNRVVPIKKEPKRKRPEEIFNEVEEVIKKKRISKDEEIFDSPFCVPVEEHVYVPTIRTRSASKNLYCCLYLLQSQSAPNYTYCGVTNNRERRIRQHNGQIKGGAKQTKAHQPWSMVAILNGFESLAEAQRFEWSMHNPKKRRLRKPYIHIDGRINCLEQLLQHDAWLGRCNSDPLKMTIDGVSVDGQPRDHKEFLKGLETHCEINYAPNQLRFYHSGGECLARKTLCELELNYCKN